MRLSIFEPPTIHKRRSEVKDPKNCVIMPDNTDTLPEMLTLISNFGAQALNAHEFTIITGTEAARTALFAKMLAATALSGGKYPYAESLCANIKDAKVLWVDTVMTYHAAVQFTREMKQHFNANNQNFRLMALTALGSDQNSCYDVKQILNETILDFQPDIIFFNDIDNLFPNATWLFCKNFVEYLREILSMYDLSVCAIAHNLIGKVKKTSGDVGEILFPLASTIYRVSERSKKEDGITRVACYKNSMRYPQDFSFVVNEFNFPQQLTDTQEHHEQHPIQPIQQPENATSQSTQPTISQQNTEFVNNILTLPPENFSIDSPACDSP